MNLLHTFEALHTGGNLFTWNRSLTHSLVRSQWKHWFVTVCWRCWCRWWIIIFWCSQLKSATIIISVRYSNFCVIVVLQHHSAAFYNRLLFFDRDSESTIISFLFVMHYEHRSNHWNLFVSCCAPWFWFDAMILAFSVLLVLWNEPKAVVISQMNEPNSISAKSWTKAFPIHRSQCNRKCNPLHFMLIRFE